MKQYPTLPIFFVLLLLALLLSSCELTRSTEDPGNITPVGQSSGDQTAPAAGESPASPPGEAPADISTEQFEAPVAPGTLEAPAVEPGKVLVKLNSEASIQARSVELGTDQIVTAGVPGLDDILRDIGASGLNPVIEEVAGAANEDVETFSAQAEEVGQLYSVSFAPENDPQEVADRLEEDDSVEYAEPNYLAGITARPVDAPAFLAPNDPYFVYQWNFEAINMPAAWDRSRGQGVTVAIVDTGIDFAMPDLANAQPASGYDFFNNDNDPTDDHGHGTHVAGTVAQNTNNELGVTGVAYEARLMAVKTLGSNGQGSYEQIIQGIIYAVDQGAQVINLSLAGRTESRALEEAVQYAYDKGVVVVAAAGNSGSSVEFPAAYDDFVIAVGATRFDNALAPYSNFGTQIDLAAPGGDTGVDQNGDGYADGILQQTFKSAGDEPTYLFFEGTSMASPHVAGVAALMLSVQPDLSPMEVKDTMMQTARGLGDSSRFGAGLVQADAAINALESPLPTTEPTVEPTTEPTMEPTVEPTMEPVVPPTTEPTMEPTIEPTTAPTMEPTTEPTVPPTTEPTTEPTVEPTLEPTTEPTVEVTIEPITPEPTLEPTVEPTVEPPGARELLTNGNFESNEGWTFGDTPIRGDYTTDVVLDDSRAVRLGATAGPDRFSFSSIWQRVAIPAEANQVTLTANVYPLSEDLAGNDIQYIAILDSNFRLVRNLSRDLSDSQVWERRSFDVSEFQGQTIYVYLSVLNRGDGTLSAMYVDDVSLVWGP